MGLKLIALCSLFTQLLFTGIAQVKPVKKVPIVKRDSSITKNPTIEVENTSPNSLSFSFISDSARYNSLKKEYERIKKQLENELYTLRQNSKKDNFETTLEFQTRIKNAELEIIYKNENGLSQIENELNLIESKIYRYNIVNKAKITLKAEDYNADNGLWKGEIQLDSTTKNLVLFLPTKAAKVLWSNKDSIRIYSSTRIEKKLIDSFLILHNQVKTDAILLYFDKFLNVFTGKPMEEAKPIETTSVPKPKPLFKAQGGDTNGTSGNSGGADQASNGQGTASGNASGNGVSITRGLRGRKITKFPSFEYDFTENAKVAVDITVDKKGNVTSATIQPKGTTTGNSNTKNIALKMARQIKFIEDEYGTYEEMGTIVFSFRIRQ